jgi:hypothetical protein
LNITGTEVSSEIIAKTCNCKDRDRKVTYSFLDSYHSLCIDKKQGTVTAKSKKDYIKGRYGQRISE